MAYQNYQHPRTASTFGPIAYPTQQAGQPSLLLQQAPVYISGYMNLQPASQHAVTTTNTPIPAASWKNEPMVFVIVTVLAMILSVIMPVQDMQLYSILGIFPLAISLQYRNARKLNLVHQIPHERKCAFAALIVFCAPVVLCLFNFTATLMF